MNRETFFGRWRVAIAAFAAQALGPGLFATYGLFVDPLSEAFGASHATLALGMSLFASERSFVIVNLIAFAWDRFLGIVCTLTLTSQQPQQKRNMRSSPAYRR